VDSIIEFAKETYVLSVACGAIALAITVIGGVVLLKGLQAMLTEDGEATDDDG
tara:strand:+ start:5426 stop:5584 length:159 start_codon:yes stop_codon:yes gene_type:complete